MGIDPNYLQKPVVRTHEEHEVREENKEEGKLGIHGRAVAVDFDLCISDGICLQVCPVDVFNWLDPNTQEMKKQSELKPEKNSQWKADPTREKDCIFCMACESTCPVNAIKITQG
ncbi:MAG: ferredoxin family protein [Candidatus Aenigmarchaeota archaeon]|nr:ferredoxin family protein [Candidatus Aenigmarchaeota archaeon]